MEAIGGLRVDAFEKGCTHLTVKEAATTDKVYRDFVLKFYFPKKLRKKMVEIFRIHIKLQKKVFRVEFFINLTNFVNFLSVL